MLVAALMFGASASAQTFDDRLLPAEEAFAVWARMADALTLSVDFAIAPGYYLYKDKLEFDLDVASLSMDAPQLPEGEAIVDEFFGAVEIYRGPLSISLPIRVSGGAAPDFFTLRLRSQGCSESPAVCYPPLARELRVEFPVRSAALPDTGFPFGQRIQNRLGGDNRALTILLFFGLGVALAFTPCSLPMLPVLSGLIAHRRGGRGRALSRSTIYVLSMSSTYAAAGVLSAWLGLSLQQYFQHPWARGLTAALLAALALAMFDLWTPRAGVVGRRLNSVIDKLQGADAPQLAMWGALSALVLSPCISPPLVAALLYISSTGDAALGAAALFAMGLGLGAPLIALGASLGALLPRAGAWMLIVKRGLGFALLGVGVWLLGGMLPPHMATALAAALLIAAAVWLCAGALSRSRFMGATLTAILLVAGVAAWFLGEGFRARYLTPAAEVVFEDAGDWRELQVVIDSETRPVMLEIYADWCIACREMEARVYADEEVAAVLQRDFRALRADIGANTEEDRRLLRHFGLFGPPASLFFLSGRELQKRRLIGVESAEDFSARLRAVLDAR